MANRYILASYDNVDEAAEAYNQLTSSHFSDEEISVITTEDVRKDFDKDVDMDTDGDGDITLGEGIAKGAVTGGLLGLIVSAVPIAIAGLPSLIVIGPVAAALGLSGVAGTTTTGAVAGGAIGGLVGALDNLGFSEEEAKEYEETVKSGGVLLAVPHTDADADTVIDLFEESGAERVSTGEAV